MGRKAKEIADLDVKDLIKDLDKAYCDEWLAFMPIGIWLKPWKKGYEDMSEFFRQDCQG